MAKRLGFISDGYTQSGYVESIPTVHDALAFEYRPALVEERSKLFAAELKGDAYDRNLAQILGEKLVSWDLTDDKGIAVPIKPGNLLRVHPALFRRLERIVLGLEPSDINPKWNEAAKNSAASDQLESALSPSPIGSVKEAADEKN